MPADVIEIVTDSAGHGLGHLRRSAALGWTLRSRGHRVRVVAASLAARPLMPAAPDDDGATRLLVLDLPHEIGARVDAAGRSGIPCVALDYFGSSEPDLTISLLERGQPLHGRRVSGLEYAIVRAEVVAAAPAVHDGEPLVVIGGGDQGDIGGAAVRLLASAGARVTWVQGPLSAGRSPDGVASAHVRVLRDPPDLATLMARCGWAVTNGGTTLLEIAYLGGAAHVLPQNPPEERLARLLLERHAILGVGIETLEVPSRDTCARVGRAASAAVDGNGATRIAGLVESML